MKNKMKDIKEQILLAQGVDISVFDDSFLVKSLKEYLNFSVFDLLSEQSTYPAPSIYGNFDN